MPSFPHDEPAHAAMLFGLEGEPSAAATTILGVPWEATTSYGRGTAAGPTAILDASVQVDLFDVDLGAPHEGGIALQLPGPRWHAAAAEATAAASRVIAAYDQGRPLPDEHPDRLMVDEASREVEAWVTGHVRRALEAGRRVGVLGGDHSVAAGAIAAVAAHHREIGVLQFDAHADLRVAYQGFDGSHASVMHKVLRDVPAVRRLVGVGLRDLCAEEHARIAEDERIEGFYWTDLVRRRQRGTTWVELAREVVASLPERVYVSFDIDVLDPTLFPTPGTPVPGGLSFDDAMGLLDVLVASGRRIVGFDLCEVAPAPRVDPPPGTRRASDEWDANVGARLLFKLIGWARRSEGLPQRR